MTEYAEGVYFSNSDDIHVDSEVQWYYIFVIFILISTPTKNFVINDILKSNTLRFLKQCCRIVVLVDLNIWVHHTVLGTNAGKTDPAQLTKLQRWSKTKLHYIFVTSLFRVKTKIESSHTTLTINLLKLLCSFFNENSEHLNDKPFW